MRLPRRILRQFKYAVFFDGVDDFVVIPLTVYGWSAITIQEWIHFYHPKANALHSKSGMIGDFWIDYPSIFYGTDNRYDYTWLGLVFSTRRPDGTRRWYGFDIYGYRNRWVNIARGFSLDSRVFTCYVNGTRAYSVTILSTDKTILEWNPDTATHPWMYRRFVLGANVGGGENMKMMQYQLLVYSRALEDSEIQWNYLYPDNPIRNGLVLWLQASPENIRDIDGDGVPEWVDLSGNNNHGKVYGAGLVQLVKPPARALLPARVLSPLGDHSEAPIKKG